MPGFPAGTWRPHAWHRFDRSRPPLARTDYRVSCLSGWADFGPGSWCVSTHPRTSIGFTVSLRLPCPCRPNSTVSKIDWVERGITAPSARCSRTSLIRGIRLRQVLVDRAWRLGRPARVGNPSAPVSRQRTNGRLSTKVRRVAAVAVSPFQERREGWGGSPDCGGLVKIAATRPL